MTIADIVALFLHNPIRTLELPGPVYTTPILHMAHWG